jgi:Flp pilus assembly protein TadB
MTRILMKPFLHFFCVFGLISLTQMGAVQAETRSTPAKIILALDTSGSLRGTGLATLKQAARSLIETLPTSRQLAIFTFSEKSKQISGFTENKEQLRSSLDQIRSGGDTGLYDSIRELLPTALASSSPLIVFTDGKDSVSKTTLSQLLMVLKKSAIEINFVTYQIAPPEKAILNQIIDITSGQIYNAATIDELSRSFAIALQEVSLVKEKPKPALELSATSNSSTTGARVIAAAVTLSTGITFFLLNGWRQRKNFLSRWEDLLDSYQFQAKQGSVSEREPRFAKQFLAMTNRLLGDITFLLPPTRERRFRYLTLISIYLMLLILFLLSALPLILSLLFSLSLYLIGIRLYIQRKTERVLLDFERDLPGALKLIAASLSAGLSFLQALETFSTENKSEVARQFRRALSEIQMGTPVEKSLNNVAKRMQSKDLEWAVFAFAVQREVGGSLAKILATTAETIESRSELRREVRTLSAEGRISSYVLMALPIGIFTFLLFARPEFVSIFWQESIGHLLLSLILLGMLFAWIWIRRLIRINV